MVFAALKRNGMTTDDVVSISISKLFAAVCGAASTAAACAAYGACAAGGCANAASSLIAARMYILWHLAALHLLFVCCCCFLHHPCALFTGARSSAYHACGGAGGILWGTFMGAHVRRARARSASAVALCILFFSAAAHQSLISSMIQFSLKYMISESFSVDNRCVW